MLSVGFNRYGNEEDLVKDPIQHLYEVSLKHSGCAERFQVYVKINKANEEEKEKFKSGEITDADSTIHAQAKQVFKDMEDGGSNT